MTESPGVWLFLPVLGSPIVHGPVMATDSLKFLKRPLDGGATVRGRRVFGDNKTWRGALMMTAGPTLAAAVLTRMPWFSAKLPPELLRGAGVPYGLVMGVSSVVGELPNSFVKRQLGIAPGGRKWTRSGIAIVVFDQADFVPMTWLLIQPLWRMPLRDVLKAFAVVTLVHMGINVVGYAIGARETWI